MFRKSKSIVGLDLGSQVVKAVEITLDGPEPVITGFARAEVAPGGDRGEAIAKVFAQGRFRGKDVVTSVSGQSVVVRYITMVKMSESELRQAIRFESDKYLPFDADEVVMDCQQLSRIPPSGTEGGGEKGDQMGVVLAACRISAVEERMKEITRLHLHPVAVDVDVFALANAWELCGLAEAGLEDEGGAEKAIALVDVGATCTSINVLANGETCFSREIGIGGSDMTQACARRLGVEAFEAEAIKRQAEGREAEVSRAIAPVLEDLVSEISLSLDYVENREGLRVEEVLLSGGGSMAPGAVSFIEQATGRPTRTWNPLEGLRVASDRVDVEELEACAPSLAVAIGLASRVRAA
ncbi:MAG: type IV pilus assembly protein PilM [Planctomycetota bacterium]